MRKEGSPEKVVQDIRRKTRRRFSALVHESKLIRGRPCREATHRPTLYDSGRPRSVI